MFFKTSTPAVIPSRLDIFNEIKGMHTVGSKGLMDRLPHYFPIAEDSTGAIGKLSQVAWGDTISNEILAGVGGVTNLNIVAKKRLGGAILMDQNERQAVFWKELFSVVEQSSSRFEFVEKMIDRKMIVRLDDKKFHLDRENGYQDVQYQVEAAQLLRRQLQEHDSWLGSDASFLHIKRLVENHRFGMVSLDFIQDGNTVKAIREQIDKMGKYHSESGQKIPGTGPRVKVLYLSNLQEVINLSKSPLAYGKDFQGREMPSNADELLFDNVKTLGSKDTKVIAAPAVGVCGYECSIYDIDSFVGEKCLRR